ncbi:unnamed protein product [Coffea canephora]|uniref:MORF/ORRM1/DAG-like MORF domain-containing protein n=1 Tax=Coffea canephora TaxID=49390 RepID=A0A068TNQ8_COFCA|nr:unnamed protein product [Coffea canephora]
MALCSLRLRRALSLSSFLLHQHFHSPKFLSPLHSSSSALFGPQNPRTTPSFSDFHSFRHFRSSPISLSSRNRRFESDDQMEITADTILFEGCDYNHWLITVDFPRDVDIPAEQKVQKYVEIAAGVFGSEEEAKKRIYACSTTTYQGFQVECSEETSEKFKENPAVVFVLPDSYIDPVNKEYGGDKYINGTIIPRPPPIMSVRRNPRQFSRPQRPENWGSGPGDARNFGPQQSHPSQQNFGPQQNHPTQQNFGPRQNHTTQQNHPTQQNFGPQQNYTAQQNFGPPRGPVSQQNYSPPQNTPPQQTYGQQQNAPPRQYYGTPENTTAHQNYGYHSPQHNYGQDRRSKLHAFTRWDLSSGHRRSSSTGNGPCIWAELPKARRRSEILRGRPEKQIPEWGPKEFCLTMGGAKKKKSTLPMRFGNQKCREDSMWTNSSLLCCSS